MGTKRPVARCFLNYNSRANEIIEATVTSTQTRQGVKSESEKDEEEEKKFAFGTLTDYTPHQKGDDLENQQDPANNAELFSAHVLDNCPSHFCSAFSPTLSATVAAVVKVKAAKEWEGRGNLSIDCPGKPGPGSLRTESCDCSRPSSACGCFKGAGKRIT